VAVLTFLLGELAIYPMPGLVQLAMDASDDAVGLLPDFAGAEEEVDCLFLPEGVASCPGIPSNECRTSRRWP